MADSAEKIALRNAFGKKLSKTEAAATYLGKNAKAVSAATADSATKALQDGNGNVIVDYYASKNDLNSSSQGMDAAILAEQMIGFYNAVEGTNLDWHDYLNFSSSDWAKDMNDFVNGYEGV